MNKQEENVSKVHEFIEMLQFENPKHYKMLMTNILSSTDHTDALLQVCDRTEKLGQFCQCMVNSSNNNENSSGSSNGARNENENRLKSSKNEKNKGRMNNSNNGESSSSGNNGECCVVSSYRQYYRWDIYIWLLCHKFKIEFDFDSSSPIEAHLKCSNVIEGKKFFTDEVIKQPMPKLRFDHGLTDIDSINPSTRRSLNFHLKRGLNDNSFNNESKQNGTSGKNGSNSRSKMRETGEKRNKNSGKSKDKDAHYLLKRQQIAIAEKRPIPMPGPSSWDPAKDKLERMKHDDERNIKIRLNQFRILLKLFDDMEKKLLPIERNATHNTGGKNSIVGSGSGNSSGSKNNSGGKKKIKCHKWGLYYMTFILRNPEFLQVLLNMDLYIEYLCENGKDSIGSSSLTAKHKAELRDRYHCKEFLSINAIENDELRSSVLKICKKFKEIVILGQKQSNVFVMKHPLLTSDEKYKTFKFMCVTLFMQLLLNHKDTLIQIVSFTCFLYTMPNDVADRVLPFIKLSNKEYFCKQPILL